MDTIGESISLVNTGENLVSKDSLDRECSLCYMLREFHSHMMMGSVSDSSLLQVPVPLRQPSVCLFYSRVSIEQNVGAGATQPVIVVDKRRSP